jgi:hypothetical protein
LIQITSIRINAIYLDQGTARLPHSSGARISIINLSTNQLNKKGDQNVQGKEVTR